MTQNIVLKEISYLKILKILMSKWHWILFSLTSSLLSAFGYLVYTAPIYKCNASLKFEDKRSELSELTSIRNIYERTNKAESEALIIKSRSVLTKAIRSLNYHTSYYRRSGLKLTETYPTKPITIIFTRRNLKIPISTFTFQAINANQFKLSYKDTENNRQHNYYRYGDLIHHPCATFKISAKHPDLAYGEPIVFHFNNEADLIERITSSLRIDDRQNINVLNLGITDKNPDFATDILNAIIEQYLIFDRSQRSSSAIQTEKFIDTLLSQISTTADTSARLFQKFREERKFIGPTEANECLEKLSSLQNEIHALNASILESSFIKEIIKSSGDKEPFNYNLLTIPDASLMYLISKYNELLTEKKEAEHLFPKGSVFLERIEQRVNELKTTIAKNITGQHELLLEKSQLLKAAMNRLQSQLQEFPGKERQFIALQSKFEIQQKVLNYLTEKKLEAQVSKSTVTSGAIIIDKATIPPEPISPIPRNIYTLSIICSLLTSSAAILVIKKLNPYINSREEIEEATDVPILGVVTKYEDKNLFSESIRTLRSNLSFLASQKSSKIIHITSEVSGEGKSFVAVNLSGSLSLIDKKVILIAADLRKSTLHETLNLTNQPGLSNYLVTKMEISDVIKSTSIPNLDFISSGTVPPNPSELLHSKKMADMLMTLRKTYDLILIDSAPIGIVSDCKPIIKLADINLFIIRAGISRREYVFTPQILKEEFNLPNMSIILNDFRISSFHNDYYKNKRTTANGKDYTY